MSADQETPNRSLPFWVKGTLRFATSVLVLGVLVWFLNSEELVDRLEDAWFRSRSVLVGALACYIVLHCISALKWRMWVLLSGARIAVFPALRFYGIGLFANLLLPSLIGGDLLRAGLAMGSAKRKAAVLLASVVDRVADFAGLGLLIAVGGFLAPGAVASLEDGKIGPRTLLAIVVGVLAVAAVAARVLLAPGRIRRLPRKLTHNLIQVMKAERTLRRRPAPAAAGLLISTSIQAGFVLTNVLIGNAIGLEMDLRLWFLLWPLAKLAAMLPISVGGIGVREAAFAALLAPMGIAPELAVAQSLLWQVVHIAGAVVLGGFAFLTRSRVKPELRVSAETD